jgi:hypothetical protein
MTVTTSSTTLLRRDLALLRAHSGNGVVQPGVFEIIRTIEIAWAEHAERFAVPIREWSINAR